jgi:hypothetical protein
LKPRRCESRIRVYTYSALKIMLILCPISPIKPESNIKNIGGQQLIEFIG